MWQARGTSCNADRFTPVEPIEVLYDSDGPRVFTLRDGEGRITLACWSDADDAVNRYLVVPTTSETVGLLRAGEMSVYDALHQRQCWACDVTFGGELVRSVRVAFDDVPADARPAIGLPFWPPVR